MAVFFGVGDNDNTLELLMKPCRCRNCANNLQLEAMVKTCADNW